jgi:hypothetical protein
MSTQLTVVQPSRPEPTYLTIEGMEGLTTRDVILPRWSIIQPTSRKEGAHEHVGQFHRNIDGEFRSSLEGVILLIQPSRIKWTDDISSGRPDCFSRDGITGSVYGTCATCQFNVMANAELLEAVKAGETRQGDVCSYGYNFLLIDDVNEMTPAMLGAMGTSVRPAKLLASKFAAQRRMPCTAVVKFTSKREQNKKGNYFVLDPQIVRWMTKDEAEPWITSMRSYKGVTLRDVDEVVSEEDLAADEGDAIPF